MYNIRVILLVFILFGSHAFAQLPYPLPASQDTSHFGKYIQRTMKLLSSSTPTHRNTVKIMVYGQSISEQAWSDTVKAFLIRKYPYANIIMVNRAIGGYASQELKKPAYHDIPSFYPDLVIFHVYGSHYDLDSIMRTIRRTTTAEVLFQNSHVTGGDSLPNSWENTYGYTYIPEIAAAYGLEFCDVRTPWYQYLRDNHKKANDLTIDGTHLNDQGNFLMARLIERYLFNNPKYIADTFKLVKTYTVGTDVKWVDGKLILPFNGNRVDIIADAPVSYMDSAIVKVDNQKPSDIPGNRMFFRANLIYSNDWKIGTPWGSGGPVRIFNQTPLLDETWIMTVTGKTDLGGGAYKIDFSVGGTKTGFDGSGSVTYNTVFSGNQFVSNSKRVIINPLDWFVFFDNTNYYVGKTFTWQVLKYAKDSYQPPLTVDPALESVSTISQGITNNQHILELTATGNKNVPIKAIRIYNPYPLRTITGIQLLPTNSGNNTFCSNKSFDLTKTLKEKTTLIGPVTYWYDEDTSIAVTTPMAITAPGLYYIKKLASSENVSQIVSVSVSSINCVPVLTVTNLTIGCDVEVVNLTTQVKEKTGVNLKETWFYSDSLLTNKISEPTAAQVNPPQIFYVKAVSDSNYSDVKTLKVTVAQTFLPCAPTLTGISIYSLPSFKLYPNPSTGVLHLEINGNDTADLSVTDLIGNAVYSRKTETGVTLIDLSNHPKGIYFARLKIRGKTTVQKIVLY